MLDIKPKQFRLTDEGEILFQTDPTNPLPGKPIGRIRKGEDIMRPVAEVTGDAVPADKVEGWLQVHIHETLQPLAGLKDEEEIQAPARAIASKLYDSFGILPRAALEQDIAGLDEEGRRALRARKIRLGPVLVFMPALNKPAAVRLRALLWNLWHEKGLPAAVPPDGVTSLALGEQEVDHVYFRAIGYPVYGPRAIRVDMLDRLITAIYDSAENGVFKARHEMAEWLGCPIPDLYAVLEAMDHKKVSDPADAAAAEGGAPAEKTEGEAIVESVLAPAAEEKAEAPAPKPVQADLFAAPVMEAAPAEEPAAAEPKAAPVVQLKPELATFRLRRGKAYGKPPRPKFKPQQQNNKPGNTGGKPGDRPEKGDRGKPRHGGRKPQRHEEREREKERIISAAPPKKTASSPFDVLKDLKVQNKE